MRRLSLGLVFILGIAGSLSSLMAQEPNRGGLGFEQIFSDTFDTKRLHQLHWMNGGQHYSVLHTGVPGNEIRKYDLEDGSYQVVLAGQNYSTGEEERLDIRSYEFSPKERYLLIKTNVEQIWRRSTKADYYIFDTRADTLHPLTDSENKIQYAHFAPEGLKVGYVYQNNLYVKNLENGRIRQLTHDGEENKIINGHADWVYEEEFSFAKAWFWSPDGSRIAFYRFDVRDVPTYTIPIYKGPDKKYPRMMTYRYPKPGETNATVRVGVYDLQADSVTWMDIGADPRQYIVRVDWTRSSETLSIRRMNRLQNRQDLILADAETGATRISRTKKSKTWIDENDDLIFLPRQKKYLFVSERSGYNHIYLSPMDGSSLQPVTKGSWEVTRVLGYDESERRVYFVSTEVSPLQRHVYSIRIDGTGKRRLTEREGWHDVTMGKNYDYYIDRFSASGQPPKYDLYKTSGKHLRTLVDNSEIDRLRDQFNFPEKDFLKVHLAEAGTLNAYMMKPPAFDSTKQYPVLMYVYGGPGSQTVTRRFEGGQRARWHAYLAQQGYIIFSIDNRGTGARGRHFEKQVYRNLGKYESRDQIAAARYLADKTFVNGERIGIWGWSYGGYMSSLVLGKAGNLFEAGISVAPVTHWKFYDTIYTERYMQTPEMNPEGYRESASLTHADGIKADFLLIHGTADDNVHFQNSVELVDEMVKHGVDFETLYYPNHAHGLSGGNTRHHLFKNMTRFLRENL